MKLLKLESSASGMVAHFNLKMFLLPLTVESAGIDLWGRLIHYSYCLFTMFIIDDPCKYFNFFFFMQASYIVFLSASTRCLK